MGLIHVEDAIKTCKEHLESSGAKDTEVGMYLASSILAMICATYEELIEEMFVQRAAKTNDRHIESFVKNFAHQKIRSANVEKVMGFFGFFGEDYKRAFKEKLGNDSEAKTRLETIVQNRHDFVHKFELKMTFDEVVKSYYESKRVLSAISEILEVEDPTSL